MKDWFEYYGHVCIAFESLGLSIFDFMVSLGYLKAMNYSFDHKTWQSCDFLFSITVCIFFPKTADFMFIIF